MEKEHVALVLESLLNNPGEIPIPSTPTLVEPELTETRSSLVTLPVHPGIYLCDLLIPYDITKKNLQDSLRLTAHYVNDLLTGDKPLIAESALFLERHFKQLKRSAGVLGRDAGAEGDGNLSGGC